MSHAPVSTLRNAALGIAAAALASGASAALPPFTFAPGAVGLAGGSFTGDNLIVSDYAAVVFDGVGGFSETGLLSVSAAQLGDTTFTPTGLNSTYGMYIAFSGTGTTTLGDPSVTPTTGSFTTLNYTLYGYNGTASFGFTGNTPTETAIGEVVLATGSLVSGGVSTIPGGGSFSPAASALVSFNTVAGAFFTAPVPFYTGSFSSFVNSPSQVEPFTGGFRIRQGGGSFNFVTTPIPEPSTYALLLAGLAVVGAVAKRRRRL
ncbi:MAG: flocculation-associated PEP-CTERM protein PepA [Rhizobiales bacterium]|nr:flocculation-associated PEP-CTERM protein PepA [Rhizobacter sp.]